MQDETQVQNDPLAVDAGDRDMIKYPLLQDGITMRFEIRDPKTEKTEDQTGEVLVLPCYTTKDATSNTGDSLKAGFSVFMRLYVTVTDKVKAQDVINRVTPYALGCGIPKGTCQVRDIITDPKKWLDGKLFDAKVTIEPERTNKKNGRTYPP